MMTRLGVAGIAAVWLLASDLGLGCDRLDAQSRGALVTQGRRLYSDVQERVTRQGRIKVETSVWYGPASRAIVEVARIHKVEEIVMTTHGRSGLGRLLLGSVAESVLRGTTTPILIVHAGGTTIQSPPVGNAKLREVR